MGTVARGTAQAVDAERTCAVATDPCSRPNGDARTAAPTDLGALTPAVT